ncbi:THUMP domain-containing protein [Metallosphaera hakonensis]|uniref:THUMP domain-containing protein n=1 Tax=Metallosphaera hakonensis TaxID=79601 RepID=UPI001F0DC66F|nr:THUMP domain-containing protein [Metallosphaera hakonensis]
MRLVVTTAPNKGNKCRLELLNRLIPDDPEARVEERVRNVLLVFSDLPSLVCYGRVISAPPACARKVYPVFLSVNTDYKELIIASTQLLHNKEGSIYIECIVRSGTFDCRAIQMAIGGMIRDRFKIDSKNFDLKLSINVIGNVSTLSLLKPGQEKVSVHSLS